MASAWLASTRAVGTGNAENQFSYCMVADDCEYHGFSTEDCIVSKHVYCMNEKDTWLEN